MAPGGARNRSGPAPDPSSGRSDRRGLSFTALPATGWDGDVPDFPMPVRPVCVVVDRVRVFDVEETARVAAREAELWQWAWRTPQAAAWAQPSERWRLQTIAMWVRTFVVCESADASAADKGSLHRFADQIGLTPAGLRENGWVISRDEVAQKATERVAEPSPAPRARRLSVAQ